MTAFELSKQQWRTLRKALHPLDRGGHTPCFSPGDLLAVGVAKFVIDSLHLQPSVLTPFAEELFLICGRTPWPQLERSQVLFRFDTLTCEVLEIGLAAPKASLVCSVELRSLVVELRESLLDVDVSIQSSLAFPPMLTGRSA